MFEQKDIWSFNTCAWPLSDPKAWIWPDCLKMFRPWCLCFECFSSPLAFRAKKAWVATLWARFYLRMVSFLVLCVHCFVVVIPVKMWNSKPETTCGRWPQARSSMIQQVARPVFLGPLEGASNCLKPPGNKSIGCFVFFNRMVFFFSSKFTAPLQLLPRRTGDFKFLFCLSYTSTSQGRSMPEKCVAYFTTGFLVSFSSVYMILHGFSIIFYLKSVVFLGNSWCLSFDSAALGFATGPPAPLCLAKRLTLANFMAGFNNLTSATYDAAVLRVSAKNVCFLFFVCLCCLCVFSCCCFCFFSCLFLVWTKKHWLGGAFFSIYLFFFQALFGKDYHQLTNVFGKVSNHQLDYIFVETCS